MGLKETTRTPPGVELGFAETRVLKPKMRMIALDMDGTLLGPTGKVSVRNLAALRAAAEAGIEVVIATGRRHSYAMQSLRGVEIAASNGIISSNGTVTRTIASELLDRTLLPLATARLLCDELREYRNSMVLTFDLVGPDGDDRRGAMVVESLEELHGSIARWMEANERYIERVRPLELALEGDAPIQAMLCGTIARMRTAEALLRKSPLAAEIEVHRTEYGERDLSIVDILPAGCSKGTALLRLAAKRGVMAAETMAIGDNWNDLAMLEVAGQAVVMGNAPDGLLETARERGWATTAGHHEDGVAQAIEEALGARAGG